MIYKNTTVNCILGDNGMVLMMRKLRGMRGFSDAVNGHGKGVFNFPGGKAEPGESFYDCCVRETFEETGIVADNPRLVGQLQFVWPDYVIVNQAFLTTKFHGDLKARTDEGENLWVDAGHIPYDNMWPSDKVWVPRVMVAEPFHIEVLNPGGNPVCRDLPLDFDCRAD
jgi:8-oxo-dGTP pyrophosphatase MutT (NUDIX family)